MDNMYQAKASRADIYAQIMNDFDGAIAALPDKPYSDAQMSGYFSPGALKALKARLMLAEAYDDKGNADPSKMGILFLCWNQSMGIVWRIGCVITLYLPSSWLLLRLCSPFVIWHRI